MCGLRPLAMPAARLRKPRRTMPARQVAPVARRARSGAAPRADNRHLRNDGHRRPATMGRTPPRSLGGFPLRMARLAGDVRRAHPVWRMPWPLRGVNQAATARFRHRKPVLRVDGSDSQRRKQPIEPPFNGHRNRLQSMGSRRRDVYCPGRIDYWSRRRVTKSFGFGSNDSMCDTPPLM